MHRSRPFSDSWLDALTSPAHHTGRYISEQEPTDNHELQERIDRMFAESDQIIIAILSKYVDELRKENNS